MAAVGASSCGLRSQGPQRRRCPAAIGTRKHTLGTPLRRMSRAAWRSGPGGAGQIQIDAPALGGESQRDAFRVCGAAGCQGRPAARTGGGKIPWKLIKNDSVLKDTAMHWRLNDARFEYVQRPVRR